MQPAKKVMCHTKVNSTANALYCEKMHTARIGMFMPKMNDTNVVTDELVIETAEWDIILPMRTATGSVGNVFRHSASMRKVSSMPTPVWVVIYIKYRD